MQIPKNYQLLLLCKGKICPFDYSSWITENNRDYENILLTFQCFIPDELNDQTRYLDLSKENTQNYRLPGSRTKIYLNQELAIYHAREREICYPYS